MEPQLDVKKSEKIYSTLGCMKFLLQQWNIKKNILFKIHHIHMQVPFTLLMKRVKNANVLETCKILMYIHVKPTFLLTNQKDERNV